MTAGLLRRELRLPQRKRSATVGVFRE